MKELSTTIQIYAEKPVPLEADRKVRELRNRLDYRLLKLELQGLNEKIRVMNKVVDLIKPNAT